MCDTGLQAGSIKFKAGLSLVLLYWVGVVLFISPYNEALHFMVEQFQKRTRVKANPVLLE